MTLVVFPINFSYQTIYICDYDGSRVWSWTWLITKMLPTGKTKQVANSGGYTYELWIRRRRRRRKKEDYKPKVIINKNPCVTVTNVPLHVPTIIVKSTSSEPSTNNYSSYSSSNKTNKSIWINQRKTNMHTTKKKKQKVDPTLSSSQQSKNTELFFSSYPCSSVMLA